MKNRLVNSTQIVFSILLLFTQAAYSGQIKLSDYLTAGSSGDSWSYTFTEPSNISDFTVNLTEVSSGPNAGKLRLGDIIDDVDDNEIAKRWSVFDVVNDSIHVYDDYALHYDHRPHGSMIFDPSYEMPVFIETDQFLSGNITQVFGIFNYVTIIDTITVQAGTFHDILVTFGLVEGTLSNIFNTQFGIDSTLVPYGVSDIEWYAKDIGLVKAMDINTNSIDSSTEIEFVYELSKINTVPSPHVIYLLLPGLLLVAFRSRKTSISK